MFSSSDPTANGDDEVLPTLPAWTRPEPAYLAFRAEGPSVRYDYPETYNWFARDLWEAGEAPTNTTGNGGDDNSASLAQSSAVALLTSLLIARLLA